MPLAAASIDIANLEHSVWSLWEEWLRGYFNGQTHTFGGRSRFCPVASVAFQQSALQNPLDGLGIHVVWVSPARQQLARWDSEPGRHGRRMFTAVRWQFLVRARLEGAPEGQAAKLAMDAAAILYWLLRSPIAVASLSQKGIGHVRPDIPVLISDSASGFAMRQVGCGATLTYWI